MSFFLKMKHWQAFLLFVVLPGIAAAALDNLLAQEDWPIRLLVNAFLVFLAVAYLWTVGLFLYDRLPVGSTNLRPAWFKAGLVFAFFELVYLATFAGFFIIESPESPYWIVPLHILAMIGVFYAFYFIAKSLAGVATGREADLNDFAGYFFMLWFFPIGIWFLQPRINRLYHGEAAETSERFRP